MMTLCICTLSDLFPILKFKTSKYQDLLYFLFLDEILDKIEVEENRMMKNVTKTYMKISKISTKKDYPSMNQCKENSFIDQLLEFYQRSADGQNINQKHLISYENMLLKKTIVELNKDNNHKQH